MALTQTFPDPLVFKYLLLLAYFSFLRLSNLLPHTVGSFDPTRQLARGDILFSNQGATLLVKWSQTQSGTSNDPVFRISRSHGLVPLTDSVTRKYLTTLSAMLHLAPKLTFHDFSGLGLLGLSNMGFPSNKSCTMGPGNPTPYGPTFKMYILPLLLSPILSNSTYSNSLAVWWISHIISPPTLPLPPSEFDLASSHFDLHL